MVTITWIHLSNLLPICWEVKDKDPKGDRCMLESWGNEDGRKQSWWAESKPAKEQVSIKQRLWRLGVSAKEVSLRTKVKWGIKGQIGCKNIFEMGTLWVISFGQGCLPEPSLREAPGSHSRLKLPMRGPQEYRQKTQILGMVWIGLTWAGSHGSVGLAGDAGVSTEREAGSWQGCWGQLPCYCL